MVNMLAEMSFEHGLLDDDDDDDDDEKCGFPLST
jgi:hypothetical protein